MRSFIRHRLPDRETVASNRWLRPFSNTLLHPLLWYLNRQSVARGVAVGLFCGLIPGPFQMLGAALMCILLRANLPLALFTTLYTNPFTIVPLYFAAFMIGNWAMGHSATSAGFVKPPEFEDFGFHDWGIALIDWMSGLGKPLALGLVLLALGLALAGYAIVYGIWRLERGWRWKRRLQRNQTDL